MVSALALMPTQFRVVQTSTRDHPAYGSMDTDGMFPGAKQPGYEAKLLPPSSAEVKNGYKYTPTPTGLSP